LIYKGFVMLKNCEVQEFTSEIRNKFHAFVGNYKDVKDLRNSDLEKLLFVKKHIMDQPQAGSDLLGVIFR